ncbi:MAG TPA: protein-L-isoaspartate(D-aspartate) O-methyltransferase [Thermoanaerobaculia bacterium]|nr:protein-L-isoaspartate(D-aspartate) O-methyltransferase [Thermoanaerobaculia bacterium]
MPDFENRRRDMVERQIASRGVRDRRVLDALLTVPREVFVPERLHEFAYDDTPLPIEEEQTISQPYIVALMAEALEIGPDDRVLEVGAGSGYAAAVLSRIAREVYAIERHERLAELARERMERLGYTNVHIIHGDGTLGWPEHAPYDAIAVAAGGPDVPPALQSQLAPGGRLVIPIGTDPRLQELVRVRRTGPDELRKESLGAVRFVPLVGAQGWRTSEGDGDLLPFDPAVDPTPPQPPEELPPPGESPLVQEPEPSIILGHPRQPSQPATVARLVREAAEPFEDLETADLGPLLDRIGNCRVAAHIDLYVRHLPPPRDGRQSTFSRFPTWMWRNREVADFVEWLRGHNDRQRDRQVSFHGLDLYSLYASIGEVLRYLQDKDPETAQVARLRYGCLSPWERDPALYGRAALVRRFAICEADVLATLVDILKKRLEYEDSDGDSFLDAVQNARIVANAERYYRIMYYGSAESWNLRDQHMFDTLETLLTFRGSDAKAVVWEHNSHIGNAAATEMSARGEHNVGQLVREEHGNDAYLLGFGTDHGTVAAATDWDGEMEVQRVRPSHRESYERLCHDSGVPAFLLPLREPKRSEVREELEPPRLERAIGVIYRPETELQSHYFQAVLPWQFDEYCWFDETRAVTPLGGEEVKGMPETYPFGL